MWIVLGLTAVYFVLATIGGLATGSLALLAAGAHGLAESCCVGLAIFAAWMPAKPAAFAKARSSYRGEVLAMLASTTMLFFVSSYIFYESFRRFLEPAEVATLPLLAVAIGGLAISLSRTWFAQRAEKESLRAQTHHLIVSELAVPGGVVAAGVLMAVADWWIADPVFGLIIGLFVLARTWRFMRQAVDVLLAIVLPRSICLNWNEPTRRRRHGVRA